MVAATTARAARERPQAHAEHLLVPEPPEGFWYSVKCRVLGPPLAGQLAGERLSRPLALGVLSRDGLSSAAYGTEEILYALLPFFGLAAFTLVLPLTLLVLRAAEIRSSQPGGSSVLACEVADSTGELTAVFLGRAHITGIEPGNRIRLEGQVGIGADGRPAMINPAYELLA